MLFKRISLLDDLLNRIGEKLQLNQTRIEKAEQCYNAVSEWLKEDEIFFSEYDINIYPQGSYRLGTTVKPKGKDEYDLDVVLEVNYDFRKLKPEDLLNHLERRLKESEVYKSKIERKKRCIGINYESDFHLDVIPALPRDFFKGENLKISDRKLSAWLDSCPKGYIKWFESKYIAQKLILEKAAEIEELPSKLPYSLIQPIQRIVQLTKRHRDIYFDEQKDNSPRSVVLTTLTAEYYNAWESESESLLNVLSNIKRNIDLNPYGKIVVVNPSNPNEKFSDLWEEKPQLYNYFKDFINSFYENWKKLTQMQGIDKVGKQLEIMFGESISREVISEQTEYIDALKKSGKLGVNVLGTLTPSIMNKTIPVQRNTFYGD